MLYRITIANAYVTSSQALKIIPGAAAAEKGDETQIILPRIRTK